MHEQALTPVALMASFDLQSNASSKGTPGYLPSPAQSSSFSSPLISTLSSPKYCSPSAYGPHNAFALKHYDWFTASEYEHLDKLKAEAAVGDPFLESSRTLRGENQTPAVSLVVKRPRGRPRKHPLKEYDPRDQNAKRRSKTGCKTCRERKKKCDETRNVKDGRESCNNCIRNGTLCPGFPLQEVWHSETQRPKSLPVPRAFPELPPLIHGVENALDRDVLLRHFDEWLSQRLSLNEGDHLNRIFMPMAARHPGLMHSILGLSASHLIWFGQGKCAREDITRIMERQEYHLGQAIRLFDPEKKIENHSCDVRDDLEDSTVAQAIIISMLPIYYGNCTSGEHASHLRLISHMAICQNPQNREFADFLFEFKAYHEACDSIASLDRRYPPYGFCTDNFRLPWFVEGDAYRTKIIGTREELYNYLSKITTIRDKIRLRRNNNEKPLVDYQLLSDAQIIDSFLRSWKSRHDPGSPRDVASSLWRQCVWIYLHRTIMPSVPDPNLRDAVNDGLELLRRVPGDCQMKSILLCPLFLLGCAAFDKVQRPEIQRAFDDLEAYRPSSPIPYARTVVKKIWKMMDASDEDSWDWETKMHKMRLDIIIA